MGIGRRLACMQALFAGLAAMADPAAACTLSQSDQQWVDRSVEAWNFAADHLSGIGKVENLHAVFFDGSCVITSATAMNGGAKSWAAKPHRGTVTIPDGSSLPAGVISFAKTGNEANFFVMSTPSVWRAAVTSDAGLGSLELLMTAVLVHEATHVAQMPTYGARMGRLAERHKLPDDFNDDSIQERFEANAEFKDSVGREIDLLLAAATARDRPTAVRLAAEARAAMKARQARWYKDSAYLAEAEDIWLTLEGSGQWVAHQWLVDPRGGAVDPRAAFGSFGWRGKWWSQKEGFALFVALDRLAPNGWKKHAFGDGSKTVFEMLDEAIARPLP